MEPEKVFRSQMAALLANDIDPVVAHINAHSTLFDKARPQDPLLGNQGMRNIQEA